MPPPFCRISKPDHQGLDNMTSITSPTTRQKLIDDLWQNLQPNTQSTQKPVILHGPPGIGKSHLAREFAHLHDADFTTIIWLDASSERALQNTMSTKLLHLTTTRGVEKTEYIKENALEFVRWLEETSSEGNKLVVYDAYAYDSGDAFDIAKYIPASSRVSVMITSREAQLDIDIGQSVAVERLSLDEAVGLLARHAMLDIESPETISDNYPNLVQIANQLDRLPLALILAGSYIRRTDITASEYTEIWTQAKLDSSSDETLAITISLSYQDLQITCPRSASLLRLLACYYPLGIWYELFRDACDDDEIPQWLWEATSSRETFNLTLGPLLAYGILKPRPFHSTYGMDRSVQDWVLQTLESDEKRSLMEIVLRSIGRAVPLALGRENLADQHDLLRLVDHVFGETKENQEFWKSSNLGGPFTGLGDLYSEAQRLSEAELMYLLACANLQKTAGPNAIVTLEVLHDLGRALGAQGRYQDAEGILLQVLTGFTEAVGPDDARVFTIQDVLGSTYVYLKNVQKAEEMFKLALAGYRTIHGPCHVPTLSLLDKLVEIYINQGRFSDARDVFEQYAEHCKETFTAESASIAHDIKALSLLYQSGTASSEESILEKRGRSAAISLPIEHIAFYNATRNIATCYLHEGKLNEAQEAAWEAVTGHEMFLGVDHVVTQRSLYYLGKVFEKQGFWPAAESLWLRAEGFLVGGGGEENGYDDNGWLLRCVRGSIERVRGYMDGGLGQLVGDGVVQDIIEDIEGLRLGNRASRL
ncbi:P-loop containing nucleoside triphosphate hydrolase protein [Aspergillus crustosus]